MRSARCITALGAESPMVLLSGHAATWELGRGGFQELRQADMAAPVTKASWTASSAETLGRDIGEAIRIATSGRPGTGASEPAVRPAGRARRRTTPCVWPEPSASPPTRGARPTRSADAMLAAIGRRRAAAASSRGPQLVEPWRPRDCWRGSKRRRRRRRHHGKPARHRRRHARRLPRDLIKRADLIVLLGKALDFTTEVGEPARRSIRRAA